MRRQLRRALRLLAPELVVQDLVVHVAFRDWRRAAPRALYLLVAVALVVTLAFLAPVLLVPLVVIAAAASATATWLASDARRVARGEPPGRLPVTALAPVIDREHFAKQAARLGPVFTSTSPFFPKPTVCVVGIARGQEVLRANEDSLQPVEDAYDAFVPGGFVRHMVGDTHRHYRQVFHDAFATDVVERCRPVLATIAASGLAALSDASRARPRRGVAPRVVLEQALVIPSLLHLFFGLDPSSDVGQRAEHLVTTLHPGTGRRAPAGRQLERFEAAARELDDLVRRRDRELAQEAAAGAEPSCFLAALQRRHPGALDDPTVLRNLVFLVRTSGTDVTGLTHWSLKLLADHPRWLTALREAEDPHALAERIVDEVLRMHQSDHLHRITTRPFEIEGRVVPADSLLRVCVHESHQDPALFPHPLEFDPSRFERRFTRSEFAPLGMLRHTCLGAATTYAIGGGVAQELARYDIDVRSDGRPVLEIGWRPSRRHRVVLRPHRPHA